MHAFIAFRRLSIGSQHSCSEVLTDDAAGIDAGFASFAGIVAGVYSVITHPGMIF
jgi:hypothetical protein